MTIWKKIRKGLLCSTRQYANLIFVIMAFGLIACHDNGVDPENHATAKLDGFNWTANAEAKYSTTPADSSVNIFLSSPNRICPETTLGFLKVPLKSGDYTVSKTVQSFDLNKVLGYYQPEARLAPFIFYHPNDHTVNTLTIESYDKLTGEVVFTFKGSFENPPDLGVGVHVFENGKGRARVRI